MVAAKGFVCPKCKCWYGDPLYHGPVGHAPQELCFDCWASEWGEIALAIEREADWRSRDAALLLLCRGFTQQEAAAAIGAGRSTLYGWLQDLRRHPEQTPHWLAQHVPSSQQVA